MEFVDHLKSQLDIVDVVGHYVRLQRKGNSPSLVGLCPFHTEKSPSFYVHSAGQFYKCFGCDAKGDLINFVMQIDGLEFWDAVKLLAERYGIPLPQRRQDSDPQAQLRDAVLEMHEIAARTFEDNLHSPAGAEARHYLGQRGISISTMREFRIGLSDARGQQLTQRLQKFGPKLLDESGLVLKRQESSSYFDRFRNRLMFAIHNESGKVIGFGGRALTPADEPKYLNSPKTCLYEKSAVLYNLHRAKQQARKLDRLILVEGYMDAIAVYQAGIHNVVASCGTSLTTGQVRSIKRQITHTDASAGQVVVNFDPDPGGARGTERSIHLLLSEGLRVKVLALPGDADPDEFFLEHGVERFAQLAQRAPSYFHWLVDRAKERFDTESAEGRAEALQWLLPAIQKIHDKLERNSLIEEIGGRLGLDPQLVREHLRTKGLTRDESLVRVLRISSSVPPNERLLLAAVLHSEEARTAVLHYFTQSGVPDSLHMKAAFQAMLDMAGTPFSCADLLNRLGDRDQKIVSELTFQQVSTEPAEAAAQALDCLRILESRTAEERFVKLKREIREAEQSGNVAEAMRLMGELESMRRQQKAV